MADVTDRSLAQGSLPLEAPPKPSIKVEPLDVSDGEMKEREVRARKW